MPPGGTGDERDLAGQGSLPVGTLGRLLRRGADADDLPGDVRRLRGQQEAQGRAHPTLGAVGDVHQLRRAAATDRNAAVAIQRVYDEADGKLK